MMSEFKAREIPSAEEFLQLSEALRAAEPISTQIIGGAASGVVRGTTNYDRCTWWVVELDEAVVGIAMHTEPFNLFLSPMPSGASRTLANLIINEHPNFPGVNGPSEVVEPFLRQCAARSKKSMHYQVHQEHLAYLMEEVTPPEDVIGEIRLANTKDRDLALEWFVAFAAEADVDNHNLESVVDRAIGDKRLYLWTVNGEVVSLAGHTVAVEIPSGTLPRIGPVYTPPQFRKRGYASFLVAEICRRLLERGFSVMLYADEENPDSNNVYLNIGFNLVGSNSIWETTWG